MKSRWIISLFLGAFALFFFIQPVQANGIIIPEPCPLPGGCMPPKPPPCDPRLPCPIVPPIQPLAQLNIKYHHVTVKIINQVATTHVDQVFFNPNTWPVEGTYVFPLPADAVVNKFILWVDGKPTEGKVMSAQEARQIYESYMRRNNDPALLEYIGQGAYQARIFPIPPRGERRIELEYTQTLLAEAGLVRYNYPLKTEKYSRSLLESVAVTVEITSPTPVRAVYSPSHALATNQDNPKHVTASYEAKNIRPDTDFALIYSLGESEAFHLFSFRDPSDPLDKDGFFMLLLAPKPGEDQAKVAKDIILVLDHSGSMEGEKFRQAQEALRYVLKHLNPDDRFALVAFSTAVELYAKGLRPAEEAAEAIRWVDGLSARGSTDINRALLEAVALAGKERPTYLLFMTDGLPTVGVTKSQLILDNFSAVVPKNVRVFPFGVGYDVDTFLLDSLSQKNHGLSTYVKPSEPLNEVLSVFYEKISTPVLTNLILDFGKLSTYDIYPSPLPDLFSASQIVVVGRYRQGGTTDVSLKGDVNGVTKVFRYPEVAFTMDSRGNSTVISSLPRLWATRKIGYLLSRIRLQGTDKETIDQIVKLSIRYGIVTPYTSYLVSDPAPLGAENQMRMAQEAYRQSQSQPTQAASGQGAVQKAADQGQLQQALQAPGASQSTNPTVQSIASRTFVLSNGIWMDTTYDPKQMTPIKVAFLSEDYFKLAQSRSDVAGALAQGERVIVVVDGKAYEVIESASITPPVVLPQVVPTTAVPVMTSPTAIPPRPDPTTGQPTPTLQGEASPVVWGVLIIVFIVGAGFGMKKLMRS